jgi:hypothetical protein
MIRWHISDDPNLREPDLVYVEEDYSIDTRPAPLNTFASVLVNDLNIDFEATLRVTSIWGLCPRATWLDRRMTEPSSQPGGLYVRSDRGWTPGVAERISSSGEFPVFYDETTGWLRVVRRQDASQSVRVTSKFVFEIDDQGEFCSLWIRPVMKSSLSSPQPPGRPTSPRS